MGNTVNSGKKYYVDNVLLAQGQVYPLIAEGGCCITNDAGISTCEVISQNECENLRGGTYLGDFVYCGTGIDTDGDGKLSRDELLERFNIYVDTAVGLQSITLQVRQRNGAGFMGAKVRLVPEPFMADYIEESEGEVIDPSSGLVEIMTLPESGFGSVSMHCVCTCMFLCDLM